ncbi:MAG: hypothetical protein ACI9G1_003781, partial [Pirellulaceae bacterium]
GPVTPLRSVTSARIRELARFFAILEELDHARKKTAATIK